MCCSVELGGMRGMWRSWNESSDHSFIFVKGAATGLNKRQHVIKQRVRLVHAGKSGPRILSRLSFFIYGS